MFLGNWELGEWLTFPLNCWNLGTGAAADADSAPTYRIYEDETGTAIANGTLALLDDGNTLGFYTERIQLLGSAGFEAGKAYTIYLSFIVGAVERTLAHTFQIKATGLPSVCRTTIASVVNQTTFTLTAGADFDHAYRGHMLLLRDVTNNHYSSLRVGTAYTGSTRTLVVDVAPDFTIAGGDVVDILPMRLGADGLAADLHVYDIVLDFDKDDGNAKDRYGVSFLRNGVVLTSGVTVAKLTVWEPSAPTTLIDAADLVDDGSHKYGYVAETTERISLGLLYLVTITATIGGAGRTFRRYVKRDAP